MMTNTDNNNNMTASNNNDNEDASKQLSQQIEGLSIQSNEIKDELLSKCANCGKEGDNLNNCNKCDLAAYCNAACKKKHRTKHKNKCERRAAELAAKLHDIELFKQPPPNEDCPICMLPLPSLHTGRKYKSCCGKMICSGCIHAVAIRDGVGLCPFCRTPTPTPEEAVEQTKKRVEIGDTNAIYNLGCNYYHAAYGLPQNRAKALELWHRAGELGHANAYYNIGLAFHTGNGVERDEKKANHYYELAAMRGNASARHNLGCCETNAGNALKHFMIAAGSGEKASLSAILEIFKRGVATKEDYTQALRAYQAYLGEIKSVQRDEAATFDENYKYY